VLARGGAPDGLDLKASVKRSRLQGSKILSAEILRSQVSDLRSQKRDLVYPSLVMEHAVFQRRAARQHFKC
jgi:hypothetical protein